MKLRRIAELLDAEVICGHENLDMDIPLADAGDLMSDVLSYPEQSRILISGLCTIHAIRTAQILDLSAIIFVRGKQPTPEMVEKAARYGIALLRTSYTMYSACGELYKHGLGGTVHDGERPRDV